jgi:predicted nucleic acid-binding protein
MKNNMEISEKSVDTNVLLYLNQEVEPDKKLIAEIIVGKHPVVSAQAVSEYLCEREKEWRKARPKGTPFDDDAKAFVLDSCANDLDGTHIQHVDVNTLRHARNLVRQHHLPLRDAVIVASSVEAGCNTLYSEDMDDGLKVEKQLTIKNPFIMDEFIQQNSRTC